MSNFSQIKTGLVVHLSFILQIKQRLFARPNFVFLVVCFTWVYSGCVAGRGQPT